MIAALTRLKKPLVGAHDAITGITPTLALSGAISPDLIGDVRNFTGVIRADLFGIIDPTLIGDVTGLYGNLTNVKGNIASCLITQAERDKGINIELLIQK